MRGFRSLVLLTAVALTGSSMTGCAPEPVKPTPQAPVIIPASAGQASDAQLDIMKFDPSARIGSVQMTLPGQSMAAVAGIPAEEVKPKDTIVFTDGRQSPVATGSVDYIEKSTGIIVVEYTPGTPGRAPVKGDLAVLLKGKGQ